MSKAGQIRGNKFRKQAIAMLTQAGATVIRDDEYEIALSWNSPRIGKIGFTLFKREFDGPKRSEIYSVYSRLDLEQNVYAVATKVHANFMGNMNVYSGKWNIHYSKADRALGELSRRIKWLSVKEKVESDL